MRVEKNRAIIWSILIVALITFFSAGHTYAAETSNHLEVNNEYKISNLEADYISGYSFDLDIPTNGRAKFIIEGCNEIFYDALWIDNGDGSRSTREWIVNGDRLDSGWISVTPGQKSMKLGAEQGYWAKNETLYIEFEPFVDNYGDIEDNDTLETANGIRLGIPIAGNFSGLSTNSIRTDIDCYSFEASAAGLMEVYLVNCDNSNYLIPFTIYTQGANGNFEEVLFVEEQKYLSTGTKPAKTEFRVRLPEGRYYILLEVDWKESSEYNLTVNFTEESSDAYEQENNNSSKTANSKKHGVKYTGNLHSKNDVDWYKFNLPAKGTVKVELWTPADAAKEKVEVTLYDKNLKEVATKIATANKYLKLNDKTISSKVCYVRVKSLYEGLDSEHDYQLKAVFRCKSHVFESEIIKKPTYTKKGKKLHTCEVCNYKKTEMLSVLKLKKVTQNAVKKINSSKVKISWKDVKNETGYQIYKMTKKNGSYSISQKFTTSKRYINLKVKKGKTYYYKVRAYKNTESGKVYGSWSAVKKYTLNK